MSAKDIKKFMKIIEGVEEQTKKVLKEYAVKHGDIINVDTGMDYVIEIDASMDSIIQGLCKNVDTKPGHSEDDVEKLLNNLLAYKERKSSSDLVLYQLSVNGYNETFETYYNGYVPSSRFGMQVDFKFPDQERNKEFERIVQNNRELVNEMLPEYEEVRDGVLECIADMFKTTVPSLYKHLLELGRFGHLIRMYMERIDSSLLEYIKGLSEKRL